MPQKGWRRVGGINTTSKLGRALIWFPLTHRLIYYFMNYSQIAKPLSTQYQVSHNSRSSWRANSQTQTKSINLNFSSQRALVHLLIAQCSALALAVFLAGFHLKLNSKQIGKLIFTAAAGFWWTLICRVRLLFKNQPEEALQHESFWWTLICCASVFSTRINRRKRYKMKVLHM